MEDDLLRTTETVETEKETPTTVTTTTTTGTKLKEQRKEKQNQQISHVPAKDLGLLVYSPQTKPFPGSIKYEQLKEFILKEKYKIIYTTDRSMKEIMDIINNNQIRFLDTD